MSDMLLEAESALQKTWDSYADHFTAGYGANSGRPQRSDAIDTGASGAWMGIDRKSNEAPDSYLIELTTEELTLLIQAAALGRSAFSVISSGEARILTGILQRLKGVRDGSA